MSKAAVELARQATSPLEELVWLAHELGHHDSLLAGVPMPDASARALWRGGTRARMTWPVPDHVSVHGHAATAVAAPMGAHGVS